ncbi:hypothetical protein QSJ18_03570 [Gordonia sp. ABSL1-1]|uniref:hypothetical protein n=1 Tax=Gordonia sp. ABSL1-1 TaxID=3053923 RepID=UPI0025748057|nr:hypothetical protein [Gordonia sp. ABSL1-1]MDL9935817.1 hypothetical protein [Gordonia sp. ABSL1-1]
MTIRRSRAIHAATIGAAAALTIVSTSVLPTGVAEAAGRGLALTGVSSGNCSATITLTNYTNSRAYQPDWWFEQENDAAMVNAVTIPPTMTPPWREVSGIPWPMARWVGSPPLHSEVADGVPVWPGNPYNSAAQPDGHVTSATIKLKEQANAPAVPKSGSYTIYFRLRSGPVTADRLPTPQRLEVPGCTSKGNGSIDWGSLKLS